MWNAHPSLFKWSIISVALAALAAFGNPARAQEATEPAAPNAGYVDDWTHHHLVFSNPGTRDDAVKRGQLDKWQGITNDPRYQLQQAKRTFGTRPVVADPDLGFGPGGSLDRNPFPRGFRPPLSIFGDGVKKDWSTALGSGTAGTPLFASIASPLTSTPTPNISGSSTLTIDGVTFDASAPTAASTEGTFSGNPSTGQTITIGALTLTASDSTQNSQTGTFSTWPATPAASTISVTNGGNMLAMTTTGSSQSTVTSGTVTNPPAPGNTVQIKSYPASGTITTTTFTSAGVATATINTDPTGYTTTVGSINYVWHGTCTGYTYCITGTGTTTTDAQDMASAINGSCGGTACAANTAASARYPGSGSVVYIVNLSTSATVTLAGGGTDITMSTATIPDASPNACSGTTGTFTPSSTIATLLGNLKAAINACPAADGITVTGTPTTTITVTSTYYGSTTDFLFSATGYTGLSWNAVSSGSDGTNSCSSSTTGTYATSSSTTTLATNLLTALKACAAANDPTIGLNVAQTTSITNTVTVYENAWGTLPTITVAPTATGFFKWNAGTLTGGTNGTTNATHFAVDNVNSDNAAALATAVADAGNGVVSATHSGTNAYATVTAVAPGSSGNSVGLGGTAVGNGFSWGGTTLGTGTGGVLGSDGTTSGTNNPPTFAYWSGSTYVSSSTLASNIATAVNANTTVNAVLVAEPNVPTSDHMIFAANTGSGNISVTPNAFSAFTGGGTFNGGTSATVQPNAYPAKWGASLTTASCTGDFVVYPTGQAGGSGAANIIAYNNLYTTGCTGTVPSVYWAYNTENTGTGYTVTTSPVLAWLDGSKVAFIQSNGTYSDLVVLKWKASNGTLTAPITPTVASNITQCTAPCMTVTALSHNDTYSSPYYDNTNDALYVGDDNGYLEKFTGVFNGTANPAETEVSLNTTPYAITSPVYDSASGCVFVGDTEGTLYSVRSGVAGSVCTGAFGLYGHSENLGDGGANEGIFDAPLVDPVAETVYAFVADSGSISLTTTLNILSTPPNYNTFSVVAPGVLTSADVGDELYIDGAEVATIENVAANGQSGTLDFENPLFQGVCAFLQSLGIPACSDLTFTLTDTSISPGDNVVDEFLTSTITGTAATPVQAEPLGTGGAGYNIYSGTFDNVYYSSTNGTGNLYALGNTGTTGGATLYQIPITYGSMNGFSSAVTGLNTTEYPWPSPVTEFCNNGTSACALNAGGTATSTGKDYLFFSVNRGNKTGCTNTAGNGCILSYNVSTPTPTTSITEAGGLNVTAPGTNGCWATGGLVIDNSATGTAGAQQIYFVNLNGAAAGGAGGAPPTSSNCTSGAGPQIQAVQVGQANP